MEKLVEKIMQIVPGDIFTDDMVMNLLPGTADSRHGMVKRAIAKGEIVHIKRGLYALAKKYQRQGINLFALSQLIQGPSYVSFESALNYHGWIPEAVYAVTGASAKHAKQFTTPLGVFVYKRIPFPMLFLGVDRIDSPQGSFLMASPWKALVDYIYVNKKEWRGIDPVVKSLRVEKESLENIDRDLLDQLQEIYKNLRMQNFIKGIKKDLSQ
jgi:predicted transcriptional regulator of viral defense system